MKKVIRVLLFGVSMTASVVSASPVTAEEWGATAGNVTGSVVGCACGIVFGGTLGGSIFSEKYFVLQGTTAILGVGAGAKYGWVWGGFAGTYLGRLAGRVSLVVAQKMKELGRDLQQNGIQSKGAAVIAGSVLGICIVRHLSR